MAKIVILEPGAWGTALGILLSEKNNVCFWYENSNLCSEISKLRENNRLPGIKIPQKIVISSELKKITEKAELIIIASSIFSLRKTLIELKKLKKNSLLGKEDKSSLSRFANACVLGVAKGIEKKTLKLPSQIIEEVLGRVAYAHLSGPGLAQEVVKGKPSKQVIASENHFLIKQLKKFFKIKNFKFLFTSDLIGVQLAGALKNVLTIGIGLKIKKSKKDLIKLGLEEMIKLGKVMGAKRKTFLGPAGLEDLIFTSSNPLSRNLQFGKALFNTKKTQKIITNKKAITIEGLNSVFAVYKLGKIHKLDLPIINEIYKAIK